MKTIIFVFFVSIFSGFGTLDWQRLDEKPSKHELFEEEDLLCNPYLYTDTIKNQVVLNNPCINGVTVWYRVDYPNGTWQKFRYNLNGGSYVVLGHSAPYYRILNWWYW
ncbi:hypothetical protein [Hyunsoonleella rubra]|uniref:Uncharacterized protein n=1 Tax=Hyunsoonleella rubra TaxID=1737062 RepID=A0ABW5T781_9FLAO